MKKRRIGGPCVFDEAFKRMARAGGPVELSHAKGSVQEAARELGIDSTAPANRLDHQMATKPKKSWSIYNCSSRVERGSEADQTATERAERRSARARYIKIPVQRIRCWIALITYVPANDSKSTNQVGNDNL